MEWRRVSGKPGSFGVELRYHSSQTIYAIPSDGWEKFRECERLGDLPKIAYVPPFSGLEPSEKWLDEAPIRQQVGKGQPGSVLRNLLLRVRSAPPHEANGRAVGRNTAPVDWRELAAIIKRWFSVEIHEPGYDSAKDVYITVEYRQNSKDYDIIAGGSGFHQTLTLLAFLYGYQPTTILLDEPDAHLHVNLQREILDYFKRKSAERGTQFLIATHAEELVRGVDASQIVSLLYPAPGRREAAAGDAAARRRDGRAARDPPARTGVTLRLGEGLQLDRARRRPPRRRDRSRRAHRHRSGRPLDRRASRGAARAGRRPA